ncbi:hypothetical protein I3760_03G037800 [Carya illinoinensis]|nr:hypothetical protein I3760_03G037800 [Carya illinoinensis]
MKRRELLVKLFEECNNVNSVVQLHSQTLKAGFAHDNFFAVKLTALYSRYTCLQYVRKLFDETPHRTVHLWNAVLRSYAKEKRWEETLHLFHHMISNGISTEEKPDNFTIPIALKACAGLRALEYGKLIHGFVKKNAWVGMNIFVGSALIEFYSKCGQLTEALRVLEDFSRPDVVMFTSMVSGYEQNGFPEEAIAFFSRLVTVECLNPDSVMLVSVVSACSQLLNFKLGSCVHGFVIRRGFDAELSLVNSLLNFYAKTGSIRIAANLFRRMPEKDIISWSSMVACFAHNGVAIEALDLFKEMIDRGIEPNSVTLISALQACADACNLEDGKKIHELAAWKGFELDVSVATALIDMYMKCFLPDKAMDVFKRIPKKDVVSWAALLGGYAYNGMAYKSMELFRDMLSDETQPDAVAMVKILAACSESGILQQAVCLHGYVLASGFNNNIFVGASLIELYSKCGSINSATKVFEGMINKDVVIWSAMIAGYGTHGQGREALATFDLMVKSAAVRPNNVTLLSILSACSHAGLVEEGMEIFSRMSLEYQLKPNPEHYGIMVDLLGRMGQLDKAMDIINHMPTPAGPHVWGALLGACRIHHNIEMGEIAAKNLLQLDPRHVGYYILLSHIYAVDERWHDVAEVRTQIKEKGLKKIFGQSVVEIRNEVRSFVADDRFHPDFEQIYGFMRNLEVIMREDGYVPDTQFILHEEGKDLNF